jgi:hypothetical protein
MEGMPRRIALLASLAVIAASATSGVAKAKPLDDACWSSSPNASICLGGQKLNEAAAATCRTTAAPNDACANTPMGHDVLTSELAAYRTSWLHRTAQFQFDLGNSVPLRDAQWLGTHNSFNTDSNGVTLSHTDNNQQLTLTQQLNSDIRAIELDVHQVRGTGGGLGTDIVRVCHGRGADQLHAGCTTEPELADVLPEIRTWLDANPGQVLMVYLEDQLEDQSGYDTTIAALDGAFGELVYHPDPSAVSGGCANLPLGVSRADMLAAGKRVFFVGNCRAGWASAVFGWDANHVESGSTPGYKAFPDCDATYNADVYATRLVRYFEDSTWLSAAVDPSETPAGHDAGALSPGKVAAMTACGVNLFGFDQFDPGDGRVAASIWSWAPDQPSAAAGACAFQRADGRWVSTACTGTRPAACRTATGWALSPAVAAPAAAAACHATGGSFDPPRTGQENSQLRVVAAGAEPWLDA